MNEFPEGNALVYCDGAFGTTYGKTAHGLVRRTRRYRVLSVVDSTLAGQDSGVFLDGKANGIPIVGSIEDAVTAASATDKPATHMVIGLATDGGVVTPECREAVRDAIRHRLNVDSGLHEYLTEEPEILELAVEYGVTLRDIRKPRHRKELHFFDGRIEEVKALKIALLGTDSALGKRTTAWVLVDALNAAGYKAEMIGTGQTTWMQGVRYGIIMDSIINDFVAGEIEYIVWKAWNEQRPDVIVIEGQGSLMNPAYPGGFELLAAGRPDIVILQHAPARKEYDGFPGYPLHPIEVQINVIQLLSGKPVVAITVNHEGLKREALPETYATLNRTTGLPAVDVLVDGAEKLVEALRPYLRQPGGL